MFSFTLSCALNELYQTPFSLNAGCYLVEARSGDARTLVVLSVPPFKEASSATQHILSDTPGQDCERILLVHVTANNDLAGLRILRHNPTNPDGATSKDVYISCVSVHDIVASINDLKADVEELKSRFDQECCHRNR